jgi:ferredoxin
VHLDRPVNIPDLEQVIPYVRARALILEHPEHLAVLDCPCRSAQANYCHPLAVCLVVGKVFVDFMLAHHPGKCRRLNPAEAEELLTAEARRGHVHHAFFKDAALGRFYAICNCCTCCCGAIKAHRSGTPMLAPSGYLAQVAPDLCRGCGLCARTCQFAAISVHDDHALVDPELCMGCGVCSSRCPQKAISLKLDPRQGLPLEIGVAAPLSLLAPSQGETGAGAIEAKPGSGEIQPGLLL